MDRTPAAREDIAATVALTLVLWAAAVVGASAAGVLAKLALEELAALCAFATAFALGAYALDAEVRAFVRRHGATPLAAIVLDGVVALELVAAWHSATGVEALAALPHSAVLLFVLPLAAVATTGVRPRTRGPVGPRMGFGLGSDPEFRR